MKIMNNIKIFCSWDLKFDLLHEKQVELYVDTLPNTYKPKDVVRFIFLLEPSEILDLSSHVLNNTHLFDYVFTHNEKLLKEDRIKSVLFPFGTTWIKDYKFPEKKFEVSTLISCRWLIPGHDLRKKLWYKQKRIIVPTNFYLSSKHIEGIENFTNSPFIEESKSPLFDSQFHIVIENAKKYNWFTEKIIDCLITKTVPIYWGCPNIGDWFNLKGFFIVDNLADIFNFSNSLTSETYNNMKEYVEENYNKALEYADISKRLQTEILKKL